VLLRGQIFGIVNFVSRPFAALATVICEYTDKPALFILGTALFMLLALGLIREPGKH